MNELAGTKRTKSEVIELLFVLGKHYRTSLEIEAGDLIEIDRGEYERPENRWPEHCTLKEEVRDVSERSGNGKPAQPQDVAHRIRRQHQDVREMHQIICNVHIYLVSLLLIAKDKSGSAFPIQQAILDHAQPKLLRDLVEGNGLLRP